MSEPNVDALSPRQLDCIKLVARNYKTKEIARILDLSPSTVDNHIHAALLTLGLRDRDEAARHVLAAAGTGQELPRQPPHLDAASSAPPFEYAIGGWFTWWPRWLPPIGGRTNDLRLTARIIAIGQIAFLAALLFVVAALLLAGVFRALS